MTISNMSVDIGEMLQKARMAKGMSLVTLVECLPDDLIDEDSGKRKKVDPSTISRMENRAKDPKRRSSGSPRVWGEVWKLFGLPLRDLYDGLGLPVPGEMPSGVTGEIWSKASVLPDEMQRMILTFVDAVPKMYAAAQPTPPLVPASPVASSQGNVSSQEAAPDERSRFGQDMRR